MDLFASRTLNARVLLSAEVGHPLGQLKGVKKCGKDVAWLGLSEIIAIDRWVKRPQVLAQWSLICGIPMMSERQNRL